MNCCAELSDVDETRRVGELLCKELGNVDEARRVSELLCRLSNVDEIRRVGEDGKEQESNNLLQKKL